MLSRMQMKYANQPVRFLVTPCNQFSHQEPGSNAEIKAFAQQSVNLGPASNVLMLAKSNLNGVACQATGEDTCMPSSTECCPRNDAVYDYLLSATALGTIKWNFDKIITGADGKPYEGETIVHGETLDADLSAVIDRLLGEREAANQRVAAGEISLYLSAVPGASSSAPFRFTLVAKPLCAVSLLAAWGMMSWRRRQGRSLAQSPRLLDGESANVVAVI